MRVSVEGDGADKGLAVSADRKPPRTKLQPPEKLQFHKAPIRVSIFIGCIGDVTDLEISTGAESPAAFGD